MTETAKRSVTQRYCTGPAFVGTGRRDYRERRFDRLFGYWIFRAGLGIATVVDYPGDTVAAPLFLGDCI